MHSACTGDFIDDATEFFVLCFRKRDVLCSDSIEEGFRLIFDATLSPVVNSAAFGVLANIFFG